MVDDANGPAIPGWLLAAPDYRTSPILLSRMGISSRANRIEQHDGRMSPTLLSRLPHGVVCQVRRIG
ncbi:MAG: hypothetical protein EA400_04435 [Chromatiaceae bacterium]|nr:MAG: hypothetical protein EA400_04435 [Chromatiaceae bacterium]